eukprot:gnl/Chilomastix_cuspidata/3516.p1 GENE.gnl/Chilomastix_cuspidata/3516~~gnl/Chilomastix_cuspidata/3516.p1  ORF type:complete len:471 (+),score=-5.40 gnl/Chilomastix_cuspidata/3516:25-1437(+)
MSDNLPPDSPCSGSLFSTFFDFSQSSYIRCALDPSNEVKTEKGFQSFDFGGTLPSLQEVPPSTTHANQSNAISLNPLSHRFTSSDQTIMFDENETFLPNQGKLFGNPEHSPPAEPDNILPMRFENFSSLDIPFQISAPHITPQLFDEENNNSRTVPTMVTNFAPQKRLRNVARESKKKPVRKNNRFDAFLNFHDGYKWRKYGQKFPRKTGTITSYYKCAVQGCPVKRKLHFDPRTGEITASYTSEHTHTRESIVKNEVFDQTEFQQIVAQNLLFTCPRRVSESQKIRNREVSHLDPDLGLNTGVVDDPTQAHQETSRTKLLPPVGKLMVILGNSKLNPVSDGFQWRKYGQKKVNSTLRIKDIATKSYYSCSCKGCKAKKTVEIGEGLKTVVVYSGVHNHEPKQTITHQHMRYHSTSKRENVKKISTTHETQTSQPAHTPYIFPSEKLDLLSEETQHPLSSMHTFHRSHFS